MKEYIEREAALNEFREYSCLDCTGSDCRCCWVNIAKKYIKEVPAADVAPVVHGRWYDEDSIDRYGTPIYRCSVCNKTVADNYISCHKFCLHCGAKMKED